MKFKSLLINETIFLAIIPFFGTYLSLVFEFGYLSYFDVPISVIQIDMVRIITATTLTLITIITLIFFMVIIAIIGNRKNFIFKTLMYPLCFCLIISFIIAYIPKIHHLWWLIPCSFFVLWLVELISPAFRKNKDVSYIEYLEEKYKSEDSKQNNINDKFLKPASIFISASLIVYITGFHQGAIKTEYWTMQTYPNMIVVDIYGDTIVLKSFNPSSKTITNDLLLINRSSNSPLKLIKSKTGIIQERS